jgi:hypothetical protein
MQRFTQLFWDINDKTKQKRCSRKLDRIYPNAHDTDIDQYVAIFSSVAEFN